MSLELPKAARAVLDEGTFCSIAARTGRRIHLTPVVYVRDADALWVTTARGSVKARAWRKDPRTAGLVVAGDRAITFRGRVRMFDLLDPGTWAASAMRSPVITRAALRFTLKTARFFAGYARDAHKVPLSWTPPARVFASVDIESAALLDLGTGTVIDRWGDWPASGRGGARVRQRARGGDPLAGLPPDVAEAVGRRGQGALAIGRAVLPCTWEATAGHLRMKVPPSLLALAGSGPSGPAALTAQRASAWRAREMRGWLVHGHASATEAGEVRLDPERVVWWRGWTTGTVGR
jgi:hypothetical protein